MTTAIVTVNASVVQAPLPSQLQQSGAMITQGGTNTAANTLTSVPTLAALEAILASPLAIASLTWSGGVVTLTTVSPHGWGSGDVIPITVTGAAPVGYNVTDVLGTITGTTTLTYPLAGNPGSNTTPGFVHLVATDELLAMGTTYFDQPGVVAPYVLELGEGIVNAGVTALAAWITDHPNAIYSWLVPSEWDNNSNFLTFLANYTAPNALTYFYITTTVANRAVYANKKDVFSLVPAAAAPATEFSCAAPWARTLQFAPSATFRVPPMSYAPLFGVTAWPVAGNQTIFNELVAANVNWIETGAQGGLPSANVLFQGNMADGNPWNFWYAGDWTQINMAQALANEIINGSATTLNPLYYDQDGINRLQNRAVQVMNQAVANGLALGQVIATQLPAEQFAANVSQGVYEGQLPVNAEPFLIYSNENPSDYRIGKYAGLAAVVTPLRGFLDIFFNLDVTNLVAAAV